MFTQNILSIIIFALFIGTVRVRIVILKRRGIKAFVFGQTDKSDFLLFLFVFAIAYAVLANTFRLPILPVLIRPFWNSMIPGWVGLAMCLAAVIGLGLTLASFGNSFRIGIDTDMPDKLITGGMFAFSRNPVYVCFLVFFIGLFLVHKNAVIAAGLILFALVIHRQVLREEKFLETLYGAEYESYCKKVRRYL